MAVCMGCYLKTTNDPDELVTVKYTHEPIKDGWSQVSSIKFDPKSIPVWLCPQCKEKHEESNTCSPSQGIAQSS